MIRRNANLLYSVLAILLAISSAAFAQRGLKNIPDPDPELQLQELQVHPDFEINLYAADPRIAKPIQMNFDAQGRLWIASSEVYPQIEPGKAATDKILVLEDQDHDGTADTTTVFADGLLIPTGVIPGDGGAYVANSTELLHFVDSDGDGVADQHRVMLSGFGTEDTHHILHTLRWGPDGMLYMNQSIYIHSHIETPYGVRRMNGGGVWHFRPETLQLETFTLGLVNPWGHSFDKFGQSFETDGAGGEGINYVFPGFVGVTSPGAKRIFHGLNPGKPKLCGLEIVGGSHLPDDWQGDLIANDFRAHRVCRYKVTEDGAGFASRELDELVKSRHQSFRPIDIKLGPDGAIYIADWYNPIIQHGEVDFRDPRRDHTHGRIWRITAKNRDLLPHKNIASQDTASLLELLRSDEPFWRQQARRILKERGPSILQSVQNAEQSFVDRERLELLWLYQSLDRPHAELLEELLKHEDPRIRAGATRVLYHWQDRIPNKLELLRTLATDEHPRVRMEAAHALRKCKESDAAFVALSSLDQPTDRFLDYALNQTADTTKDRWIPALKDGSIAVESPNALLFALRAADSSDAVPLLLSSLPQWKDDAKKTSQAMQMIASRGNADDLSVVFNQAMDATTSNETRTVLLSALVEANRRRKIKPNADLSRLAEAITSSDAGVQSAASELAGRLAVPEVKQSLINIANSQQTNSTRAAAIRGLAAMQEAKTLQELANSEPASNEIRTAAIAGLASFEMQSASQLAATLLTQLKATDDPSSLIRSMLSQDGGDAALTNALTNAELNPDIGKLAIRVARTSGRDVAKLVEQIQKSAGISGETKLTPQQREQLIVDAAESGDPAAGESVYRRAALNCQKCHAIGGAGGKVGPDIASIGASAPPDYILESLLDPGAKIKENYHSQIVATDEGQVITGVLVRQTNDSLLLRDAEDNEISIPLDSIEERKDGGSLMPAGLLNDLTRKETVDLLRFLTELGKVGPYAAPKASLVRSFETPLATEQNEIASMSPQAIMRNENLLWQPVYGRVGGQLPLNQLSSRYLRFSIDMNTAGTRTLAIQSASPVDVFVDGKAIESSSRIQLDLEPGSHSVLFVVGEAGELVVSLD